MKKAIILSLLLLFAGKIYSDGALGVQLGPITFGLGGSCNGPIIAVGPSPSNGLPFSAVIVPGSCCGCNSCGCNNCAASGCSCGCSTCCN